MKKKRILFLNLSLWELARLVFLVIVFPGSFYGAFVLYTEPLLLMLLLGSGNLLIPAGSFYLYFTGKTSAPLVLLLVAGKCLQLFTCVIGILPVAARVLQSRREPSFSDPYPTAALLAIIFQIDLIFLVV